MTWPLLVLAALQALCLTSGVHAQDDITAPSPLPTSIPSLAISAVPALLTLPPLNASHPLLELSFPPVSSSLYITLNLCSLPSGWNASSPGVPGVLVSRDAQASAGQDERDAVNRWAFARAGDGSKDAASGGNSASEAPNRRSASKDGKGEVWKLEWDKGFANWTSISREGEAALGSRSLIGIGLETDGTYATGLGDGNVVLQLGVASSGPLHSLTPKPPFVSDTTSTTALIFSPLLSDSNRFLRQPSYPNYTIPTLPAPPPFNASVSGSLSTMRLVVVPTDSSPSQVGLDNSLCAADLASNSTVRLGETGNMVLNRTEPRWMRIGQDGPGYRSAWVVEGLQSGTNYTVWMERDGALSAPAWFATKSETADELASFACSLLLPTDECPGLSYAAPLPIADSAGVNATIIDTLPDTTSSILTENLASFRTSLLSQACGRDKYSHVSTCLDCHEAYRDWLCRMLIPRCTEVDPGSPSANNSGIYDDAGNAIPPAIIDRTPTPFSSALGLQGLGLDPAIEEQGMMELAPCLATCHAVERQCPAFLKFRCPHYSNGAGRRYGFHGDRSASGNGDWGTGWPGVDRWGNACKQSNDFYRDFILNFAPASSHLATAVGVSAAAKPGLDSASDDDAVLDRPTSTQAHSKPSGARPFFKEEESDICFKAFDHWFKHDKPRLLNPLASAILEHILQPSDVARDDVRLWDRGKVQRLYWGHVTVEVSKKMHTERKRDRPRKDEDAAVS